MLVLLRSRRWIAFTLLVVVAIIGFGLLSRWQWERADERRGDRVALDTQSALAPVPLARALDAPGEWSTVIVEGVFDDGATVLVRQRPLDGRNGFWVASALDTGLGRVWVNRGWIPSTAAAAGTVAAPAAPEGAVTVQGRLRLAETSAEPAATDLPAGQVPRLEPAVLGADVTGVYIEATAMSPADTGVVSLPPPVIDETRNISYAVQWLIFAIIALAGWWFFLRREAREDAQRRESPEGSQSSNWVA